MAGRKKNILDDLLSAREVESTPVDEVAAVELSFLCENKVRRPRGKVTSGVLSAEEKRRVCFLLSSRSVDILQQVEKDTSELLGGKVDRSRILDCALQVVFEDFEARKKKSKLARLLIDEQTP